MCQSKSISTTHVCHIHVSVGSNNNSMKMKGNYAKEIAFHGEEAKSNHS